MSTFLLERELRPRLPRLVKLLQMKPNGPPITTTTGTIEHPLGSLKLRLVEFFVAALRTSGEVIKGGRFRAHRRERRAAGAHI